MSTSPKRPQRGRPLGSRSFDPGVAAAFGSVVRAARLEAGISQEALAYMANVERSYFGRVERGQSQPTLHVVLKVSAALGFDGGDLVSMVQREIARLSKQKGRAERG